VVGLSQSAPQSSRQEVIGQVLGQLQPTIARTVAQILGGRASTSSTGIGSVRTSSSGFGQGVTSSSFGQGATSSLTSTSGQGFTSYGQGASGAVRTSSSSTGLTESQLTSSVVASLQPSIAAAVAEALRSSSTTTTTLGQTSSGSVTTSGNALSEEEEAEYNAKLSANAQYEYGYKVADDESQAYMAHEEVRNGQNVEGKYNYVDATGALVTVTYQAGPQGYTENREVQDGAVQMRNIPGPWEGPYADTVPAGVSTATAGPAPSVSGRSSLDQNQIIQMILRQLQPQISGAVQSAIASSRRTVQPTGATAGVGGVFSGDNSVRIQTPEFNIAY